MVWVGAGCATSDETRLQESRDAFLLGDLSKAENALATPEVFKNSQNRLAHFCKLSSIAFNQGLYEKAIFYLNKARETSNSTRSETGFTWVFSGDYRGNPLEYSYLHFYLIMANELLADAGKSLAWTTAEIKDENKVILVQGQSVPERILSSRDIADYRQKARAELLAWDTHLQNLRKMFPQQEYYKEDLLARTLGSFLHGRSSQNSEKRLGELLSQDALKVLSKEYSRYPSFAVEGSKIEVLEKKLQTLSQSKSSSHPSFLLLEAGVMDRYKMKRFHLGISTIFKGIKDPGLRSAIEQIGMHVILETAPEFGLVLLAGGVVGAIGQDPDDEEQVHYFSEAIDRSLGFEMRFPTLPMPAVGTQVKLTLSQTDKSSIDFDLPLLSPLQEMIGTDMRAREDKELFERALKMGTQYMTILVPAIIAYKQAQKNNNVFMKLGIIAGFFFAKKGIDHANQPDLRSWDYLPKLIAGTVLNVPAGEYQAKVKIENLNGQFENDLGSLKLGAPEQLLVYKRIGEVPLLKSVKKSANKSTQSLH